MFPAPGGTPAASPAWGDRLASPSACVPTSRGATGAERFKVPGRGVGSGRAGSRKPSSGRAVAGGIEAWGMEERSSFQGMERGMNRTTRDSGKIC